MSGTPRFVTLYGVHPSGTSIQRSGSSREIFLTASANLIRNREFHVDYLGHAHLETFLGQNSDLGVRLPCMNRFALQILHDYSLMERLESPLAWAAPAGWLFSRWRRR